MNDFYRFDRRNKEQFQEDIKLCTNIEFKILNQYLDLIEFQTQRRPKAHNHSPGRSGDYLENNEVSSKADYSIDGQNFEIKFSKQKLKKYFHLKASQIKAYLKQDANILMVDGALTENPQYVLLDKDALQAIQELPIVKFGGMGGKDSYRIPLSLFVWKPLKWTK